MPEAAAGSAVGVTWKGPIHMNRIIYFLTVVPRDTLLGISFVVLSLIFFASGQEQILRGTLQILIYPFHCVYSCTSCMNSLEFWYGFFGGLYNHVRSSNQTMLIIKSVLTFCSLLWLLWRAWQTLWKPVPDLINILGVEVPDAPEVSLASIHSHAITLHLTKLEHHKPVVKYSVQVNGVNVGDLGPRETSITIKGLKPAHFYNVRVISVGANNFQAGSQVIRLRTFGRNGRPKLGSAVGQSGEDSEVESGEESPAGQKRVVGIETAALPEGSHGMVREQSGGVGPGPSSQRRNTGTRKHSASAAGQDQSPINHGSQPEDSMHQLTERLEGINREKDEIAGQIEKDTQEFETQRTALIRERNEKKQVHTEKQEASQKLKLEERHASRLNEQAQKKKSQKEKVLKDKKAEKEKTQEEAARWETEIAEMRATREFWLKEREIILKNKDKEAREIEENKRKRQNSLNTVDEQIRIKGLQISALEQARKTLPGVEENEESKLQAARDLKEDQEWQLAERKFVDDIRTDSAKVPALVLELQHAQAELAALQNAHPMMHNGNSSGVDFDPTGSQGKAKSRRTRTRKSRTSTISSPINAHPIGESQYPSASAYNSINNSTLPVYAPGPYMHISSDSGMVPLAEQEMSEEDRRFMIGGAPLSPSATQLLPSNLFGNDDPPSPRASVTRSFAGALNGSPFVAHDNGPQSPESSSRSASLISSPRDSSQNLTTQGIANRDYGENDRRSMHSPPTFGAIGSPVTSEQPAAHKNFRDLFTLPRARGKTMQEDGPALGSLKQGQSQSFPRALDGPEALSSRPRRTSGNWSMSGLLGRSATTVEQSTEGNGPAPARNPGARRRRGFNMFGSSMDDPNAYPDRDPSSPRPLSVASSDLPRPSTDSAPFGWGPAQDNGIGNSPLATNWSHPVVHQPASHITTWSRNPSRRPSLQHGSSTHLPSTSGVASEDDEILYPDEHSGHASPPPGVGVIGVIGTRPSSSHKPITPKLNPAAPAFKGFSFNRSSKSEKEKDNGKGKAKSSEKPSSTDDTARPPNNHTSSPPEPRKSRDTPSIRTQYSTAESHDSLASLEPTSSNTPSEIATPIGSKDKDSAFRQLLRKGSSSKFSISSFRNKDSSLFGSKKAGSAGNSDRNASVERDGSLDEFGEDYLGRSVDSITSSPMIGSVGSGEFGSRGKDGVKDGAKEGRMSMGWNRLRSKKGKRESMDEQRGESDAMISTEDEA